MRLELTSTPESVTLVRVMLGGVAERLAFDSELLDDLKTAVSEACNNVVMHAYGEGQGPMAVELDVHENDVAVAVRDWGSGIQQVAASDDRMGVGMAVISALADSAEFLSPAEGGTEVRMAFTGRAPPSTHRRAPAVTRDGALPVELSGDVVATLSEPGLLAGVLGRLARALAANAHFSLDRFSDVYLVTDAIASHAEAATSGHLLKFALAAQGRQLEMAIGPLRAGASRHLAETAANPGRPPLAVLADEVAVEAAGGDEVLRISVRDRNGERS